MSKRPRDQDHHRRRKWVTTALAAGPALLLASWLWPVPGTLPPAAWHTAGLALWMALWWSTETVSVPVTALLPLLVLPLAGISDIRAAAAPYAHPLIFLFLGGFLLALAIQKHGLHRRVALTIVLRLGTRPAALVAGFLAASGLLSMWVSNTATAMMLLPVAISVIGAVTAGEAQQGGGQSFGRALLLAVAYGASIGGLGTLIGTPPNALLAAYAEHSAGLRIGFAQWMVVGLPMALVLGGCAWLVLTRLAFRLDAVPLAAGRAAIRDELAALGPMSRNERRVAVVFCATAIAWLLRPVLGRLDALSGVNDSSIAIAAALALFLLPAAEGRGTRLLAWRDAARLPWGTLLLFGGGLSLAAAIGASGLADGIGRALQGIAGWPLWALVLVVAAVVVVLTELTSNTATTATFLPLTAALALAAGLPPLMLMGPVALAASAAFMLPVATPPNAIVYGSGLVPVPVMVRSGIWLNLAAIAAISLLGPLLIGLLL